MNSLQLKNHSPIDIQMVTFSAVIDKNCFCSEKLSSFYLHFCWKLWFILNSSLIFIFPVFFIAFVVSRLVVRWTIRNLEAGLPSKKGIKWKIKWKGSAMKLQQLGHDQWNVPCRVTQDDDTRTMVGIWRYGDPNEEERYTLVFMICGDDLPHSRTVEDICLVPSTVG